MASPVNPTWVLSSADSPLSLPVMGQFDPKIQIGDGSPIWQTKPGIMGAKPWIKYIGKNIGTMSFEFVAIATTVVDPFPVAAWRRLNELAEIDETLGRPHRVYFVHGPVVVEGYITGIPSEIPIEYWDGNLVSARIVRQIGPVRINITRIPKDLTEISLSTNYVTRTEDTLYEELARAQYNDARYGQSLAIHNQGVAVNETIEVPRLKSGLVSKVPPLAPQLEDAIEGL